MDPPPFPVLYRDLRDPVLWYLRKLLRGTGVDPDDVAQKAWTEVWRHHPDIRSNPRSYVLQTAHNTAVSELEQHSRAERAIADYAASFSREQQDSALDELDAVLDDMAAEDGAAGTAEAGERSRRELLGRVMDAVERLPFRQRAVILLWISEGPAPTDGEIGARRRHLHAAMNDEIAATRADDAVIEREIAQITGAAPRAPETFDADDAAEVQDVRHEGAGTGARHERPGARPTRPHRPSPRPDRLTTVAMVLTGAGGLAWTVVAIVKEAAHEWVVLTGAALMFAQGLVLAACGQRRGS
ncbi:RNA polymerase sigma factor [Actinomadura fibrosa]|uniref:RNA polymerase sigma factor n=1 Tax=Actinomadura fibrosa TaxID=111802 RepID=A0ABW2XZD5_9ACTN|nr:sigma factor [Actinomadura fibrosa]